MKIADLFAEVGFRIDTIKLNEVVKLIGDLNISSIIGATSLVGLGEGIKHVIESSGDLSSKLLTLQANTGIDTKFAQQFEDASKALGSSKENAEGLLTSLSSLRQNIKFGGSVPRGLSLMGINYQDIMGSEEDLLAKINRILSQKPELKTQAQKEGWASFLSSINKDLGATPDMLKVLSDPSLFNLMSRFLVLTKDNINANAEATKQWNLMVQNINTEFQTATIPLLKEISRIITGFNEGTGFKDFSKVLETTTHGLTLALQGWEKIFSYIGIGLGKISDFEKASVDFASHLGIKFRSNEHGASGSWGPPNVTVHAPVTVQADDPYQFVRKFDEHFKKVMSLTASQFTLGQT